MKINVLFFGILTDITGTSSMEIEDIENIRLLKSWLWKNYPKTKDMDFQIALNKNIIEGKAELNDGDEVALLPPFAGG
ncbi:MAG: MoaD/ThiS family protein [Bacteroidales bacterium]|nr:MoaD/ThiS family protein [Bacteroidales bacterium]